MHTFHRPSPKAAKFIATYRSFGSRVSVRASWNGSNTAQNAEGEDQTMRRSDVKIKVPEGFDSSY